MLALTLLLLTAADDLRDDLPTGSAEPPGEVERVRPHVEVSFAVAGGLSSVPNAAFGAGVHFEGGVVLNGTHVLSARASLATIIISNVLQLGASFAERVGDRVTLGAGLTWGAMFGGFDFPSAATVSVPLRVTVRFGDLPRRGVVIGAELAPGLVYAGGGYGLRATLPGASLMAQLTAGWALW